MERRIEDPRWYRSANCATVDFELFFPGVGNPSLKLAKKVCSKCIVVQDCLNEALQETEQYGVRGGMSANQRRKLLKQENSKDIPDAA